MDERARITLSDVAMFLMAFAILGALAPVAMDLLNKNAGELSTGQAYIFQLLLPVSVLVLLIVMYRTAVAGAR